MENKKILILTASFGAGHNSVAKAIKNYLLEEGNKYEIEIHDFIESSVPSLNNIMVKFYEFQTKNIPIIYNIYYYFKKNFDSKYDKSYKWYVSKLKDFIDSKSPNIIISTFPQASACLNGLKKEGKLEAPFLTVITDVVSSKEWIYPETDAYFVASNSIKDELTLKGVKEHQIFVTGVPVDKEFLKTNEDNLNESKYNILILGGGRGLFDISLDFLYWIDYILDDSSNNLSVSIVTGSNKNLYKLLTEKRPLKNVKVFGFIDNMSSFMKNYNLLITKPGGATLFEAINLEIPVVVKKPNIGQEIENAKFIKNSKVGIVYKRENELKKIILSILHKNNASLNYLKNLQKCIVEFKKELKPKAILKYINTK